MLALDQRQVGRVALAVWGLTLIGACQIARISRDAEMATLLGSRDCRTLVLYPAPADQEEVTFANQGLLDGAALDGYRPVRNEDGPAEGNHTSRLLTLCR